MTPHPPIIIPEIGSKNDLKKVQKTCDALKLLNKKIVQSKPKTIILISPHAPLFPNFFAISSSNIFSGNFQQFGDFKNYFEFKCDIAFSNHIFFQSQKEKIPCQLVSQSYLDHGALVPLYYLIKNLQPLPKLVLLSFSLLDLNIHFKFGQLIQKIIQQSTKKIALVASGDLSHRLTLGAPAGFHSDGKKFDEKLIQLLKEKRIDEILNLNSRFIENAGECGLRSLIILLGALDKVNYTPEIMSYEGPFGVGYLVTNFELTNRN
ncbi:MAG: class III extradiol dioxygenase subunit B-like domain-containing protein [Patescibacteria group bacterium]